MRIALVLLWLVSQVTGAGARPIVVFLSDFGTGNEAVALCHGSMLSIDPEIEIVDLTHAIPPFNIGAASAVLARATTFPIGTVFVSVVDPGVGTQRRAIALRTRDGSYFIAPDNGLLTRVIRQRGVAEAVELDAARVNPSWRPGTFDGRDLFAPMAARLAGGRDLRALGTPIDSAAIVQLESSFGALVLGPGRISGTYVTTDEPYGNVWTDIPRAALLRAGIAPGSRLELSIGEARLLVPFVTAFGDVPEGQPLAYLNSEDRLAFAVNLGDFREKMNVREGAALTVTAMAPSPADTSRAPGSPVVPR
jgi:S-adenosyl-L-methionine hydrolase (adenosine-forming)